jgi:hypothetical protein
MSLCIKYILGRTLTEAFESHPADMTQAQWNIVMETNALLHGSYVRQPRSRIAKRKVERAMYPAFKLRPRPFEDFNASLNDENIVPPSVCISLL